MDLGFHKDFDDENFNNAYIFNDNNSRQNETRFFSNRHIGI